MLAYTTGVISGSLPSSLTAYNDYTYSRTIALSSVKPGMIQNKDNLHIIAIVVNTGTKKAINANRCYISDFVVSIPGDVNDDNIVNIEDVTVLIDYLLSGGTNTINTVNADVNSDERISIDDVTALIDLLLNNAN